MAEKKAAEKLVKAQAQAAAAAAAAAADEESGGGGGGKGGKSVAVVAPPIVKVRHNTPLPSFLICCFPSVGRPDHT
jgi:hypothetical protein